MTAYSLSNIEAKNIKPNEEQLLVWKGKYGVSGKVKYDQCILLCMKTSH
jgi:hypothetical protein